MLRTMTLAACAAASLTSFAAAQQAKEPGPGDATVEIAPLPDWSIRKEVDRLDDSMKEYNSLINSLSRASADLGEEFQKYLKDPHNELLASSVEKKMAIYAKTVMADFDDIIADQDLLGSNFRELRRKLSTFSQHLGSQARGYKLRLDEYRDKARDHEKRLVELSVRIKEDPPEDPDELKALKRDFAQEFRRYRLQARYVNGYQSRLQGYKTLEKNMGQLADMFVNLHEKFNELIENLENERQYLNDSLRLQADTLRIKQIIRDGILGSEQAIGNVADKLADLYTKVDAFSQVHERINSDLHRFVESQGALMDVTKRIDSIGTQGGLMGDIAQDMEKAIDTFYDRRDEPDGEELLLEEKAREERERKAAEEQAAPADGGQTGGAQRPSAPPPTRSTQPASTPTPAEAPPAARDEAPAGGR